MAKVITGWECPLSGEKLSNEQVAGYGNPPSSPFTPDGMGSCPMTPIVEELSEDVAGKYPTSCCVNPVEKHRKGEWKSVAKTAKV